MAAGFQCGMVGLTDGVSPATAVVSPNLRVSATLGRLSTLADVVQFTPPPSVAGNWVVPAMRCLVGGIPAIHASSVGIAYSVLGAPTGPMQKLTPDLRASGS